MTRRALSALLILCAVAACRKEVPLPPVQRQPQAAVEEPASRPDNDADNVLNLAYGASVVSRGGEANLEASAAHALDGFEATTWASAPGAPEETLVFSLLAPTRIQRVGVTVSKGGEVMDAVAFDVSADGRTWQPLTTLQVENVNSRQLASVPPTIARFLRVRTVDRAGRYYVRARGFHAIGEEVAPPATPPFSGCWTINGVPARLEQNGARITGVIETTPPTVLDGGTDNRVASVMWMQGPSWGYAVLTRTPDGQHVSGMRFYEEVDAKYVGEGWFGGRCAAGAPAALTPSADPRRFLERAKRYSLFGLAFDGGDAVLEEVSAPALDSIAALIASSPSQRFRVRAHELREDTPAQNRQHTAARLESLRAALKKRGVNIDHIDFVAAGDDWNGPAVRSALQRSLVSRVDLLFGT